MVRAKFAPHEFPSSLARLYAWTPEECIPELYTDPSVLRSLHEGMPDLAVPDWARGPEDFVQQHRCSALHWHSAQYRRNAGVLMNQ